MSYCGHDPDIARYSPYSLPPSMAITKIKKTNMEQASVMVVSIGDAIRAGSSLSFLASMGSMHPSDFATSTVTHFDPDQMIATIDKYFGDMQPKGSTAK